LQKAINKFRACVVQVGQFNESRASVEDQLNQELQIYTKDQKVTFKYLQCYNLLLKCPKWSAYLWDKKKEDGSKASRKQAQSPSSEAPRSEPALVSAPFSDVLTKTNQKT
jgi:hypothetical protein